MHDTRGKSGAVLGARRRVDADDLRSGDAAAGREYFNGPGSCVRCHSATGDLADVADRLQGLTLLQRMLNPRTAGGAPPAPRVTVTLPSGQSIAGRLAYRDDFTIALRDSDGWHRSWSASKVKYVIEDPTDAHIAQLEKYTDADMHNVVSYLMTLKSGTGAKKTAPPKPGEAALPPPSGPPALAPAAILTPA